MKPLVLTALLSIPSFAAVPAVADPSAAREALIERVKPSVVQILAKDSRGSGFIIDSIGLIVTNAHVVNQEKVGDGVGVRVFDPDSGKWEVRSATVWAKGRGAVQRDIALVRLSGPRKDWPKLEFASAKGLKRGRGVIALGFPLGDPVFSQKEGTVSALAHPHRSVHQNYFEHSAVIVPGNSGGPVIGLDGRVLGVNTEVGVDADKRVTGISYAVKSDDVLALLAQFRKQDHIDPPELGMLVEPRHQDDGKLGRPVLVVVSVLDPGPAKAAGIAQGDVILEAGGAAPKPLDREEPLREFERLYLAKAPGDVLRLTVQSGEEKPRPVGIQLGPAAKH